MSKKLRFLALALSLMLLCLTACGNSRQSASNDENDDDESDDGDVVYLSVEDALVAEAKNFANKMAQLVSSGDVKLYTGIDAVLALAANFQNDVTKYDEPLSATRYVINRNSLSDNPTGGALTHDELLAAYTNAYPNFINQQKDTITIAAASVLTLESAFPIPAGFDGTQMVELRYSPATAVCVVYTETDNGTLLATAHPIIGEVSPSYEFPNFIASGTLGATFSCSTYDGDPSAVGHISECRLEKGFTEYSTDKELISAAAQTAMLVGKRANTEYISSMVGSIDEITPLCLSCKGYTLSPTGAIVLHIDDDSPDTAELYADFFDIADVSSLKGNKTVSTKVESALARMMIGYYVGDTAVAAQAVMSVTTAYRTDNDITPTLVILVYEIEDTVEMCFVSITPADDGCILANAAPMWTYADDILYFYRSGDPDEDLSDLPEAGFFASGYYVDMRS